ncbi:hypothetical protein [Methanolapillus millepedarum]|uniref:Uncharacterized protein n=1 Tax=Methanolapillus millepedarum TaxID=3028296 RepID=A0AA96V167_9EURY|nr:hypothetical protein MsAc7_00130 [Methanosarcinaceae archaeon Ac7]
MSEFLSPAWVVDNSLMLVCVFILVVLIIRHFTKNPFEKSVNEKIKIFGWDSFLNKSVAEIEEFLKQEVNFSNVDYTASDLAKEIYLRVNRINRKEYEKTQMLTKTESETEE